MIKLIITDLDGTFLNSQGDYNRALFEEVKALMAKKQVHFALCTGKQCERVEELFGADATNFWILGDSASRIKHKGEFAYQSLIGNSLGMEMIATLEQADIGTSPVIIACTPQGAVLRDDTDINLINKVKSSYAKVRLVEDYQQIEDDFIKITVYDADNRCAELKPHMARFENKAYVVVSEPAWMDIADYGVHKGNTVARLQQLLNITPEETMVFGDGMNDVELMECGTYSFAVSNAFDEIKRLANYITGSNDEDGVMRTIQHMLALQ